MRKNRVVITILFISLFTITYTHAQTVEQAKALFKEGKFEEAMPVFEKQVEASPRNANYNYWYGVCLYETGAAMQALPYLKFAAQRKVPESQRYYGDLCFELFDFEGAIEQYEAYIKLKKKEPELVEKYQAKIETATTAARMVERVSNIEIIDSLIVDKENLFSEYKKKSLENNILRLSDVFETNGKYQDIFMYINQRQNRRIFPYPTSENGYDLIVQDKLADNWGNRVTMPHEVNTPSDENYPFVMADGVTIYFASKGHNSIGGYDLFVTRYNAEEGTYFPAENLGMPFNSPANDYMYAVDENHNIGWFVTDRGQKEGKAIIYTFIPNENREIAHDKTPEEKQALARIHSIKDSWKQPNYQNFLQEIYRQKNDHHAADLKKQAEEFHFYIDENTVYTNLENFKSVDAKGYFMQYQKKQAEVDALEKELEKWRLVYAKENKHNREDLKNKLLEMEKKYENIVNQPRELANKARQAELKK